MKMKKILSVILAAVMLLGCMSITAFAENEEELFDETINFTEQDVPGAVYETIEEMHDMVEKVAKITTISTEHFTIDFTSAFCSKMERIDEHSGEVMVMDRRWLEMSASSDITISSTDGKQTITKVEIKNGYYNSNETANGQYFTPRDENVTVEANNGNLIFSNINSDEITITSCWFQQNGILQIKVYYTQSEEPENDFLTSFTLNKDYTDKFSTATDAKSTAVKEDVIFAITPVTENAPTLPGTFTMEVKDGVGTAEVDLPTSGFETVGDYWYTITETAGTTAGVTYNDTTYYLHLIVSYKDGTFGVSSAAIRTSSDVTTVDGVYPDTGKIDTVTNIYGEGSLTVGQVTTVNGEASSEDTFEATVTFTLPEGTELCGDITYGDNQKVTFDEDGVGTVTIELKGGDTVTFEHIPDGVTYTVKQTGKNEDKGYTLDSVVFDIDGETGDTVSDAMIASGTVSDAADTITITNSKTIPIDVGVILENGAFIVLALGAIAAAAWLIASKRRKSVDAE